MKRFVAALCLLLLASAALAQPRTATVRGSIRDSDGAVINANVQARNAETGAVFETSSDAAGYAIAGLPRGTYEIVVPPLGFRTDRFAQSDVRVRAGQVLELNIELKKSNLGVVGDDAAYLAIRDKYDTLEGPTPRTAAGKPDLSGVWLANLDPEQKSPDALPWAAEELKRRVATNYRDMPAASCLPDPVQMAPVLHKFVQTEPLIVQIIESVPSVRQIFLDGRPHPRELDPTWIGHSIGRWDGETLVVETIGFNADSWLFDGSPHTEQLRVVERFTRPDLAHLRVDITMEDPGAFKSPWELHMVWHLAPGEEVGEYVCNENNKYHENIAAPSGQTGGQ